MTDPQDAAEAAVILADAINQVALVVEELAWYSVQHGYTDETAARRLSWQRTLREQRESVARLIP